ncbi:Calx-beta domain-containing protein [Wenzhouxiangella sp. EGI_FJ10409]|uniref:Calx-beta domain-containing protein n=1 Tax=Wenzhouxiangella sp. EGI_FJ10409 TaxID=3243767 RepID=UPI0035D7C360
MYSVQSQSPRRFAILLLCALLGASFAASVGASISEPDHLLYGQVSWYGEPVGEGELTLQVPAWDGPVARYELGSDESLGGQYALRIPMNSVGERIEGTARAGDEASIYLDGELVAMVEVGSRGMARRVDVDPETLQIIGVGMSIADTSVDEGAAGETVPAEFVVSLTEPMETPASFEWATSAGSATGGSSCQSGADYISDFGTGTIAAGDTETTVTVATCGNDVADPDRDFFVEISDPSEGLQIVRPLAVATILDTDTRPVLGIQGVTIAEPPAGGTVEAIFRVSLSESWNQNVTVQFATQNGTAVAGEDYVATSGTVSFAPGQQSRQIPVTILANPTTSENRNFFVELSNPVEATIGGQGQAQGLIVDALQTLVQVDSLVDGVGVEGMSDPARVAVSSPDGAHVYVVSRTADELVILERDSESGQLTPVESLSVAELASAIGRDIGGIDGFADLVISPDGANIYAVSEADNAIVTLDRQADSEAADFGQLTLSQVLFDGDQPIPTAPPPISGLSGPRALAASADGDNVYVAAGGSPGFVVVFSRDSGSGELAFEQSLERGALDPVGNEVRGIGNASAVALSGDGSQLYIAGRADDAVAIFNRNTAQDGRLSFENHHVEGQGGVSGIAAATSLAVSADGAQVYVAGHDSAAIAIFERTGNDLAWVEALVSGSGNVQGLNEVESIRLSPDNEFLYAVSTGTSDPENVTPGNLVVFRRDGAGDADPGSLQFEEIKRNGVAGINGLWGASGIAVSPDNAHVYVVARFDRAITTFARDLLEPVNPELESVTHEIETWNVEPQIEMQWTGALDLDPSGGNLGSGVAGYSVEFTRDASPSLDAELDVAHEDDPNGVVSEALEDGDDHWFHLRVCDNAGNCSEPVSSGPYWIDATLPQGPFDLDSQTHEPGAPAIPENVIEVNWTAAVDPGDEASGMVGYSYSFTQSPDSVPNTLENLGAADTTVSSDPLGDGLWWFHIRALDAAGNAGDTRSIGPFAVGDDVTAPRVFGVSAVAAPDGDLIVAEQALTAATSQLLVRFDKPMRSDGPGAADDPANFRLLSGHHEAPAVDCGQPDAGLVAGVEYLGEAQTSVLDIASDTGLAAGDYTLVACDSLEDFNGNALDGNGDGLPGTDYLLRFSVAWTNLVPNPNFDAPLGADNWVANPGDAIAIDSGTDAGEAETSGSVAIETEVGGPASYVINRCVAIDSQLLAGYAFQARVRMVDAEGDPNPVEATASMAFFEEANCETSIGGDFVSNSVGGDTDGAWANLSTSVSPGAVAGAAGALLTLNLDFPEGESFPVDVWFDNAHFFSFGDGDLPTAPPAVSRVLSSHGAEYGDLAQPLPTEATVTQLVPEFTRGVQTDAGGLAPESANNPDNYRLFDLGGLARGGDPDCDAAHDIGIAGVEYQAARKRSVVRLAGDRGLPAGNYRLAVCRSIRDFDNNELDGQGDGTAGTDYLLDFEVATTNLLRNPNLDRTLGQWSDSFDPGTGELRWSGADADGLLSSGAVRVRHDGGLGAEYAVEQCVELDGLSERFAIGASILVNQAFGQAPVVDGRADFFDGAGCTGGELGELATSAPFAHGAGQWQATLARLPQVPDGAVSARVRFEVRADGDVEAPFDLWLDRLLFRSGRADVIYRNRFTPEIY